MLQLVIGIVVLSAFAAVLALLLEVADAYLGFYGECHLSINNGEKELTVQGGGTLLAALIDQGIFIPSACGGRGSCGYCKLKVIQGGGALLPTETPYLEPDEIKDNVRLSCQIKVRNDLLLDIPPELFLIKEYTTKAVELRELTTDIQYVKLALNDPEGLAFKPGQYIQLQVPEYEVCDESIYRAYSIASAASKPHEVSLFITRVEEGIASTFVHDFFREGDEVTIVGPFGDFCLHESDREIFLIATGSGLAPIMSILYYIAEEQINRKTTLVYGARHRKDLFYIDELHELENRIAHFHFIPTLSRPEATEQWEGSHGRVTTVLDQMIQDGTGKEAYICGSPAMVENCIELLEHKGLPLELIFFDKFE